MSEKEFETLAIHAGEDREANFGAVSVPIYTSSVFAFSDADEGSAIHNELIPGYYYGRLGNPTQAALEKVLAELEGGEDALAFSSGMAAVSGSILSLVKAGGHIVAPSSMYSTTSNFLSWLSDNLGIETSFIDAENAEAYRAAARPNTKLFWLETPSNPLVRITDIEAVARIAGEHGITTIADNTFATPYNQRPLQLGIDLVLHSATKYLGGHSDLTAGAIVGRSELVRDIRNTASKLFGGNIAPQVAWLVMRGVKTLALRMQRHNHNAFALANMLSKHPKVKAVYYPGLETHTNHGVAVKQMRGFGGMMGLDVGTIEAGKAFVNKLKVCTLATSLGGVETLVQHSASMTHATIPREARIRAGISDGLLRISVGIEHIEDIRDDIYNALG